MWTSEVIEPDLLPSTTSNAALSDPARRVLRFIQAWAPAENAPISPTCLEPLFAAEPPGAMTGALTELCAKHVLRRTDGWHYALRTAGGDPATDPRGAELGF